MYRVFCCQPPLKAFLVPALADYRGPSKTKSEENLPQEMSNLRCTTGALMMRDARKSEKQSNHVVLSKIPTQRAALLC